METLHATQNGAEFARVVHEPKAHGRRIEDERAQRAMAPKTTALITPSTTVSAPL